MFQFSKKAEADAEVQDLTEEQLLEIAGGTTTHKTTHHTNKGHHTAKGHTKTHHHTTHKTHKTHTHK